MTEEQFSPEDNNTGVSSAVEAAEELSQPEELPETEDTVGKQPAADADAVDDQDTVEVEQAAAEEDLMAAVRAEAAKNMEGWQRTLAEFQNYKRRVEREQRDVRRRAALDTITKILPIIDDFERAMNNVPEELEDHSWASGVALIQNKFKKLLEEYDVEPIDPVGEVFDPNLHQAVSRDDSDEVDSEHVIETLQKGYISGDVLLRPALVRIAN